MADSGNIKVIVRCRPLNGRERARGASNLIEVTGQHQLVLSPPGEGDSRENARASKKKAMPFSFDRSYGEDTEQQELFEYVGLEVLEHSFSGFNTCVFAYGQTGSGKSHSMVGYAEEKGLIPLTCSRLFDDITEKKMADPNLRITVEVSYIEIYNEKVRDLLNPKNGNLRVREHPSLGPYVEDLSKLVVKDFNDIENLMDEGNKARTVAATNMNETSSRSHAVFTLVLTQKRKDGLTNLEAEKVSRISLVDLAGSERANSTGATGSRLKEGANINRSLTTLGKVIAALAVASMEPAKGKRKVALDNFVPYRDSTLTWLLKDSLGGNSKTAMIAAISPADYEETLSTLRYADQAKKIKNKAVVNEDPNAKLIRELKEELEMLRNRVPMGGMGSEGEDSWDPSVPPEKQVVRYRTKTGEIKTVTKAELQDQMEQSEKLMDSLNQSWEQKVAQTHQIQIEREKALEELGISVDKGNVGVHTPKKLPHLVNLNEDPLMSECLIYQIKPGSTSVGNLEGDSAQIRLSGTTILAEHCTFENKDGVVTIHSHADSMTMVNGKRIAADEPRRLRSGSRIILGDDFRHVFRFNNPEEVRKARDRIRLAVEEGEESLESIRPDSPVSDTIEGDVDWTYARREAALAKLSGQDVSFDALNEDDLEKLYEDITRARSKKTGGGTWRPDSVLSSFDDASSETASSELRPYSMSAYTDDTSMIDPWYVEGPPLSTVVTPDPEMLETAQTLELKKQVKEYEEQLSRLAVRQGVNSLDLPANYSSREKSLLRKALEIWRGLTNVSMAEDILSHAAMVKEANVISRELKKQTTYQFTIVDKGVLSNATSSIESIVGLDDRDNVVDSELTDRAKPCVAIKVMDQLHKGVYVWSISKLELRLQKMRNLYTFIDRPEYGQHFDWADPFYEENSTGYTFLGNALLPLAPLCRQVSAKYNDLAIHSRFSFEKIATCTVELKFVSLSSAPSGKSIAGNGGGIPSPIPQTLDLASELSVGQRIGCQMSVTSVRGLSKEEWERVHVQVRLSSLTGQENSEVFTSIPVESQNDVKLRKTVSFTLCRQSIQHLREGFAPIEFYAKVHNSYLTKMEKYDAAKEAHRNLSQSSSPRDDAVYRSSLPAKSSAPGRLSEKELIAEERHDVLVSVQICEMDASGEYAPVQVRSQSALDPGAFFLRQGLQRKVVIQLSHNSGRQFPWSKIDRIQLGNVRLLDTKGKIYLPTLREFVSLQAPLKQQTLDFQANGTSTLTLWAWWDSSVHDSIFLNRATSVNHRVLLSLHLGIDVESCEEPVELKMDIAVSVHSRDAKPPGKLYSLLESATIGSRTLQKTSNIFAIRLTPPMTKKSRELWRLDTAMKYVRGQEKLEGVWKPRGVSLINEHADFVKRERRSAEVDGVRALLQARPPLSPSKELYSSIDKEELLTRAIESWKTAMQETGISVLPRDQTEQTRTKGVDNEESSDESQGGSSSHRNGNGDSNGVGNCVHSSDATSSTVTRTTPKAKLRAEVTLIPRTDVASKRGYLSMPLEAFSDEWQRRWFVLKRPYLYIYDSSSELDEIMVIHLGSVRAEYDENIVQMLKRPFILSLYTASNSYFLQAPSQKDMDQWLNALAIRARR
ncbi:hypothetical protein CBS101457_004699 [Exobasidium rhododendri]|nr:hypothetical protein CBS101457_004699 [Exobasidium rhododendri]